MTASVTYGRAARATPKAPRAASYTTTWDTALGWVDWFNNRRLLAPIGNIPPTEAEANFYAELETEPMAA